MTKFPCDPFLSAGRGLVALCGRRRNASRNAPGCECEVILGQSRDGLAVTRSRVDNLNFQTNGDEGGCGITSASSALFAAMALTARSHVTVVSLADMRIARLAFSRLDRTSKKRQSLRREIFAHIARNAILQHPVLLVLRKHPALQRKVLMELARNLQLRNKLLRVCGRLTV